MQTFASFSFIASLPTIHKRVPIAEFPSIRIYWGDAQRFVGVSSRSPFHHGMCCDCGNSVYVPVRSGRWRRLLYSVWFERSHFLSNLYTLLSGFRLECPTSSHRNLRYASKKTTAITADIENPQKRSFTLQLPTTYLRTSRNGYLPSRVCGYNNRPTRQLYTVIIRKTRRDLMVLNGITAVGHSHTEIPLRICPLR